MLLFEDGDAQDVVSVPLLAAKKLVIGAWKRRRLEFGLLPTLGGRDSMEAMVEGVVVMSNARRRVSIAMLSFLF